MNAPPVLLPSPFPPPCRALAIIALLKDEPRLAAERAAHAKKRGAYQGYGSYDVQAQGGSNGDQLGQGQAQGQNHWQTAAGDGGHLQAAGEASPEYRERGPMDGGLRAGGETKGVR